MVEELCNVIYDIFDVLRNLGVHLWEFLKNLNLIEKIEFGMYAIGVATAAGLYIYFFNSPPPLGPLEITQEFAMPILGTAAFACLIPLILL